MKANPKTIYLVRCVPLDQLNPVLDLCRGKWPKKEHLTIFTNGDRLAELAEDPRVDEAKHVIDLDKEGFVGVWNIHKRVHAVVIPPIMQKAKDTATSSNSSAGSVPGNGVGPKVQEFTPSPKAETKHADPQRTNDSRLQSYRQSHRPTLLQTRPRCDFKV